MDKFFKNFPEVLAVMSEKSDGNMLIYEPEDRASACRLKFLAGLDIDNDKVHSAVLTHSANVRVVSSGVPFLFSDTDGLVTSERDLFLAVTVAYCYPVIFYERKNKIIGIAHAGWKGISRGVIGNTILEIKKMGGEEKNIFIAIGPGICQEHFEFDDNLAKDKFPGYGDKKFMKPREKGKIHLNILGIIISQLESLGIEKEKMEISDECTFSNPEKYFSSRRDKKIPVEAMMVLVGLR